MGNIEALQRIMDLVANIELMIDKLSDPDDQYLIRMTIAGALLHDLPDKLIIEYLATYKDIHCMVAKDLEKEALYDNEHLS